LARLYADENFPYSAVEALRRLGHDVLTAKEAGQAGLKTSDEEALAFAHADGRAVLTHNRKHFRNLHRAGASHSGVILCTEDPDFDSLAARVDGVLSTTSELTGQLLRVTRPPG
jgi:predicted nuclease of predicted toxin-antitoxin system